MRRLDHRLAGFADDETAAHLKGFLHDRVYFAEPLVCERRRCAAMIGELFDHFMAHPERLPENYVEEMANQPLHRIVCDYIAGMTDGFFMRCYENRL